MSLKQGIVHQAANTTSSTTQDFTDASFSGDVLAAINISCRATALDTATATGAIEIGFTDLTSNLGVASSIADASATPGSRCWASNSAFLNGSSTNGTRRQQGVYSSTLSSGIRASWTAAPATADLQSMCLLGGTGVEFKALTALFTGSPNTDQVINHTLGGTPDWIFAIGTRNTAFDVNFNGYNFCAGFWSAATQAGVGMQMQTATVPTNVGAIIRSSTDSGSMISTTPAVNNTVTISAVGATTFTVSTGGGGNNAALCFLVGRGTSSAMNVKVGIGTTPTSVTTQSITGMAGAPTLAIIIPTRLTSTSLATDDTAGSWGIGIAVNNGGSTQQKSVAATTQDNVNPSVAKCQHSTAAVLVLDNTGARDVEATVSAWNSDGITLNYTNVNAAAFEYIYLLAGSSTSSGGSLIRSSGGGFSELTGGFRG